MSGRVVAWMCVVLASACVRRGPEVAALRLGAQRLALTPRAILERLGDAADVSQARCDATACAACLDFGGSGGCVVISSDASGSAVTPLAGAREDQAFLERLALELADLTDAPPPARFAPTASVFLAPTVSWAPGAGVELGVRRWTGRERVLAVVAGWDHGWHPAGAGKAILFDVFALGVRVEWARWSSFAERWWGVPGAALGLFVHATLTREDGLRSLAPGARLGVSLCLNRLVESWLPPLVFTVASTLEAPSYPSRNGQDEVRVEPGLRLTAGLGF